MEYTRVSNGRSPMSRSGSGSRPRIWSAVFALIVLVLVLMASGYHIGSASAAAKFKVTEARLIAEEKRIRLIDQTCTVERDAILKDLSANVDRKLRSQRDAAKSEYATLEADYDGACQEEKTCDAQRLALTETLEDAMEATKTRRQELSDLRSKTRDGYVKVQELTHGDGPAAIAAAQDVEKLEAEYLESCTSAPGCVMEPILHAPNASAALPPVMDLAALDEAFAGQFHELLLPPLVNTKNVYFPPTDFDKDEELRYFGRTDTEAVTLTDGTALPLKSGSHSVMSQYYRVLDAAVCAVHLANDTIMVDAMFRYDARAEVKGVPRRLNASSEEPDTETTPAHLDQLFATALVKYCENCDVRDWSSLCASHDTSVPRNYGTAMYWAARSMVRATRRIRGAAYRFWAERDTAKVLAVVAHLQPTRTDECMLATFNTSRGPHYAYYHALRRASESPPSSSLLEAQGRSAFAACSTSAVDVAASIVTVLASAEPAVTTVYLDMPRTLALDVLMELEKTAPSSLPLIVQRPEPSQGDAAADELLSHEIASYAAHLLVSPYLHASQYVVESFLLRHKFSTANKVWYF